MSKIEITLNNVQYQSIGSYHDNQDGIDTYMPDEKSNDIWIKFLKDSDPLITLWSLGSLDYQRDSLDKFRQSFIEAGGQNLIEFLKKYYCDLELKNIFIDFIFNSPLQDEFCTIYHKGQLIKPEYFDFYDHVFIENDEYEKFINDLEDIILTIEYNIKNG